MVPQTIKTTLLVLGRYGLILWLTISALFLGLVLAKGNPVDLYVDPRLTPEIQERLRQLYGYDLTPFQQYQRYLGQALKGQFGFSFTHKSPVVEVLQNHAGRSLYLGGLAYTMGFLLTTLLLWLRYGQRHALLRRLVDVIYTIALSTPIFVTGVFLIALFAMQLKWFPLYGAGSLFGTQDHWWAREWERLHHAFLPAFCLALAMSVRFTAYLSAKLRRLERAPFVIAGRGRGLTEARLFWRHKLPQLVPDVLQLMGLYLPVIGSGALVIEQMFGWSGLGVVMFDALGARDYPLLLGGTIWLTVFVMLGYESADFFRKKVATRGALSL